MSTSAPAGKSKKKKSTKPAGLPDERFWIKYSQNHELPLSVTSSVFIHVLAFGFVALILAGIFSGLFGRTNKPEVKSFAVAGGGGNGGTGDTEAIGEASIPTGTEAAVKPTPTEPIKPIETKELLPPNPSIEPIVKPNEGPSRIVEETILSNSRMSDIAKKANEALASAEAKRAGPGEKGTGGGRGGGNGTGTGTGNGDGSGNITSEGQKRNLRWTMIFRTYSGADYLKQLHDLNATLAVPEGDGEFLVFRDLGKRPYIGHKEQAGSVGGIRWTDDRADSVPALARSLGLKHQPPYIMAFFKGDLEAELRRLEKQRFSGDENLIEETIFRVVQRNGRYVPEVADLKYKR